MGEFVRLCGHHQRDRVTAVDMHPLFGRPRARSRYGSLPILTTSTIGGNPSQIRFTANAHGGRWRHVPANWLGDRAPGISEDGPTSVQIPPQGGIPVKIWAVAHAQHPPYGGIPGKNWHTGGWHPEPTSASTHTGGGVFSTLCTGRGARGAALGPHTHPYPPRPHPPHLQLHLQ